ncbi:MAG: VWA domain-containing protein [Planctomycetota bacterium]|nr:MAG: VWA domain-containing protein [Planctomycetota bacterium]
MQLTIASDRQLISTKGGSVRHLHLCLQAPIADTDVQRPSLDLALVLDRSGSMSGEKWERACQAAQQVARRLQPTDRLAVVAFDTEVDTVLPPSPGGRNLAKALAEALTNYGPRGGTNLGAGWLSGCALVGDADEHQRLRRCFLMTDGQANDGITEPAELAHHASELARRGVRTSTFGIGDDFEEGLLGPLADAGGGAFFDIAEASGIAPALDRELGETLAVVERSVTLRLNAPGIKLEVLGNRPTHWDGTDFVIDLGDLVSDQELDILIRCSFPAGAVDTTMGFAATLASARGPLGSQAYQWIFAARRLNKVQGRNRAVDLKVAQQCANLARRDATLRNRDGDLSGSAALLFSMAEEIRAFAFGDSALLAIVDTLEQEAHQRREQRLEAREAKEVYTLFSHATSCMDVDGTRRRSGRVEF